MSPSKTSRRDLHRSPIADFQYLHINLAPTIRVEEESRIEEEVAEPEVKMTETAFAARLAAERASGFAEAEARLRAESQRRSEADTEKISAALVGFEQTRKEYFLRVEAEVVQLALTIAGKILHRESQVDPLLVAALVQIALGQLKEGAAATIRVRPEETGRWGTHFAAQRMSAVASIVEDAALQAGDCVLETEMGTVNFSLEAQLKEVEHGFLDLLAQRPQA